tara:strand:- start:178 stop:291 length:114 start_codon:yes stop_codon:yes gene_type:complete
MGDNLPIANLVLIFCLWMTVFIGIETLALRLSLFCPL